jgi:hypothetical protein
MQGHYFICFLPLYFRFMSAQVLNTKRYAAQALKYTTSGQHLRADGAHLQLV